MKEELRKILDQTKENFDFFLNPSEQRSFWATFGWEVYHRFLVEDIQREQETQLAENLKPMEEFKKTAKYKKWLIKEKE